MNSSLTIGRVAAAAGVNVETIRFYQRLGLLAEPVRPLGGVRRYGHEVVVRLRFIKRAQQLGFSLAEVQRLLILEDPQSCGKARSLAAEKLALIEARIADLKRMRGVLKELVARCDVRRGKVACPIIATLTENPEQRLPPCMILEGAQPLFTHVPREGRRPRLPDYRKSPRGIPLARGNSFHRHSNRACASSCRPRAMPPVMANRG